MKRFFWVLFVMSLWGHLLMAQEKAVSGIVVSTEDGLPMIGVAFDDRFSPYENTASLLLGI